MNRVDTRTQRTTQAQSLPPPPPPAASCISGLPAASASSPALFPSILFLLFPFSHSLRLAWPSWWRETSYPSILGVWVLWDTNP